MCEVCRAALRCPSWPPVTARAARSGVDSTRRVAWHRAGPQHSPFRCAVLEERRVNGDFSFIRDKHSPGDLDEEDSSRVSWRTDAHCAMWSARIARCPLFILQARNGFLFGRTRPRPGDSVLAPAGSGRTKLATRKNWRLVLPRGPRKRPTSNHSRYRLRASLAPRARARGHFSRVVAIVWT
jgi:hypothetical protein